MTYQILGRAIRNEHLALGVLVSTFGTAFLATRRGSSAKAAPTTIQQAKESIPISAGSSEEEQLLDSIQKYIAEAEKDSAATGKH